MSFPFFSAPPPSETPPTVGGYASISKTWMEKMASTVTSWVNLGANPIKSVSAPIQTIADTTTKSVDKSVGAVVSGFKTGTIILVLLAGLLVFAYVRPFLPSSK